MAAAVACGRRGDNCGSRYDNVTKWPWLCHRPPRAARGGPQARAGGRGRCPGVGVPVAGRAPGGRRARFGGGGFRRGAVAAGRVGIAASRSGFCGCAADPGESGFSPPNFAGSVLARRWRGAACGRHRARRHGRSAPAAMRSASVAMQCAMSRRQATMSPISRSASRSPPPLAAIAWDRQRSVVANFSAGVGVLGTEDC